MPRMDVETRDGLQLDAKRLRDRRGRVRPDTAFKERLLAYVKDRRAEGASLEAIATEVNVPASSLARWTKPATGGGRLRRVRVADPSVGERRPAHRNLSVHGPRGLRIEGLTISGLAELLRLVG